MFRSKAMMQHAECKDHAGRCPMVLGAVQRVVGKGEQLARAVGSALAAGDNFPALVAFSPRSELRRVGTQALRHLRGVGWARFRPRSGLRDARNVSTTSVGDVRGHSALA